MGDNEKPNSSSSSTALTNLTTGCPFCSRNCKRSPNQLSGVASDQQSAGPTLKVEVNRDVASRLGVDPAVVDSILYDASVSAMWRGFIRS
jgi:multidrug efflux pump subunit AcrB